MATWSKLFSNFVWKNKPDTSTPLGQTLLNRINTALNGVDDRVVALNAEKANLDDLNGSIVNVSLNEKTGVFTFTKFDGTTFTINTALEEVVTNWKFDYSSQSLVLTLSDGTTQSVDLSSLITQYEFVNTPTVTFVITDGKVQAYIAPNSITDQMLQKNYLADITMQANTAVAASQSALESQVSAENDASVAETSADSALASAIRAEAAAERAEAVSGIDIATTEKVGIVKPDGSTITIDEDGTIHSNSTSTITVDTELSKDSENPIANKAVANAVDEINENVANITNGATQVGNAKKLDGHGAEYFAKETDLANYLPKNTVRLGEIGFDEENGLYIYIDNHVIKIPYGLAPQDLFLKSGGTINGTVEVSGSEIVVDPLRVISNHKADNRVLIEFRKGAAVQGYLGFYGGNNPIFVNIATGASHTLFHDGNKPTGTYTGNGSETERTVNIGGIGTVLHIMTGTYSAFVTANGALVYTAASTMFLDKTKVRFVNGALIIATTDVVVNGNGFTYNYYLL